MIPVDTGLDHKADTMDSSFTIVFSFPDQGVPGA